MTIQSFTTSPRFSHTANLPPPKPSIHPLLSNSLNTVKQKKACHCENCRPSDAAEHITIVMRSSYKQTALEKKISQRKRTDNSNVLTVVEINSIEKRVHFSRTACNFFTRYYRAGGSSLWRFQAVVTISDGAESSARSSGLGSCRRARVQSPQGVRYFRTTLLVRSTGASSLSRHLPVF